SIAMELGGFLAYPDEIDYFVLEVDSPAILETVVENEGGGALFEIIREDDAFVDRPVGVLPTVGEPSFFAQPHLLPGTHIFRFKFVPEWMILMSDRESNSCLYSLELQTTSFFDFEWETTNG